MKSLNNQYLENYISTFNKVLSDSFDNQKIKNSKRYSNEY